MPLGLACSVEYQRNWRGKASAPIIPREYGFKDEGYPCARTT